MERCVSDAADTWNELGGLPDEGNGSTSAHEHHFVDHLHHTSQQNQSTHLSKSPPTVVIVSMLQAVCSQSIQTMSKPIGARYRVMGTELRPA